MIADCIKSALTKKVSQLERFHLPARADTIVPRWLRGYVVDMGSVGKVRRQKGYR